MRSMPSRSGGGGGRGAARDREGKPTARKKFFVRRRKVCKFCAEKLEYVDWKDVKLLQRYISERGKIVPSRITAFATKPPLPPLIASPTSISQASSRPRSSGRARLRSCPTRRTDRSRET